MSSPGRPIKQIPTFPDETLEDYEIERGEAFLCIGTVSKYRAKIGGWVNFAQRAETKLYEVSYCSGEQGLRAEIVFLHFKSRLAAERVLRCVVLSPTIEQAKLSGFF